MLVMKETAPGIPAKRVAIGETVVVKTTNQTGEVIGYTGGQWEVRTSDGNVINVSESQLEVRQVLFG